ncbi:MAG TPA: alkaline phosphatase family protein [Acidimicrobiia bacterium]|nr:alkaline phosphatase family protein [Acidimicrobiia bacterium]
MTRPFEFGAIGDTGFTADVRARFPGLVADMNAAGLAFSVHDGNIGADPDACTDGFYAATRDLFDRFDAPLVYTPGDNEWLNCKTEGMDPVRRLAALRRVFFSSERSRGATTLQLERQTPNYPENARWRYRGVSFATLHVVGSHDDLGSPEFTARRPATIKWLEQTFDRAKQDASAAIVLVWQADPYFQQDVPAYNDLRGALRAETMAFRKPVLLVHGDSGRFGIDKPMVAPNGTTVANFTRLQTFGPADAGWVRVGVDPAARDVFSFRAEIPPGAPAAPTAGAPCGTRSAPPDRWGHVIWIWMENKERDEVVGNPAAPYESALAEACGTARQYSSVASPSLPNYLAATAGRTFGVTDDAPPADHSFAADNLFRQVRALGRQARSYQEDMPGRCVLEPSGLYVVKHNPAPYYKGGDDRAACQRDNLPLGSTAAGPFASALDDGTLPAFSFVTPNLCNDTHDCPVKRGDVWLSAWLGRILTSRTYRAGNTAVFVIWDEPGIIPNVVISPTTRPGTASDTPFDHYALLRTTEDMLGIGDHLGRAATARSMRSAFRL